VTELADLAKREAGAVDDAGMILLIEIDGVSLADEA
jgi:hypothetical protein